MSEGTIAKRLEAFIQHHQPKTDRERFDLSMRFICSELERINQELGDLQNDCDRTGLP